MRYLETLTAYPSLAQIHAVLREKEETAFLDSSLQSELGEYSILGVRPYHKLVKNGPLFTVNDEPCQTPFMDYLKAYLDDNFEADDSGLPITNGAIGYFSYEFGCELQRMESRHEKELEIPECLLTFYDAFLVEDHRKGTLTIAANGHTADARAFVQELKELARAAGPGNTEQEATVPGNAVPETKTAPLVMANFDGEDYKTAVDHMIQYIVDGDIYVVNMTQQLKVKSLLEPYEMFRRLRESNPSPFGAYLDYGDFQIVCASPERFLKMTDGDVRTRPIKGTRKRGSTPEEDAALKKELEESEKDQSELLMIVDLERNDLNRVCVPGSVKVTELFKVETYATVFHLVANVSGHLLPGANATDLLLAAFPGGSITGAPKLRAMELIDQEEHSRRNLYTGSIGYLSLNGDCDLNIVIRTAVHKDGVYHIGVGGGITCESDLDFEYEETWQKARALLAALEVKEKEDGTYEYTIG